MRTLDNAATPSPLRWKDRAIAVPAFRTLAWVDGTLRDDTIRSAVLSVFDLFADAFSGKMEVMKLTADIGSATPTDWDTVAARRWIGSGDERPHSVLGHGPVDPDMRATGVPDFRLAQFGKRMSIEVSIAPGDMQAEFTDHFHRCLMRMPLFCGLQSMGFYQPASLFGLLRHMPQSYPRYRAAVEIPVYIEQVLRRQQTSKGYPIGIWAAFPNAVAGLPDTGWRTMVGPMYRERLATPDKAAFHDDVVVHDENDILTLTAGPTPIWGDVNAGEDIAAYQSVARYLRPIMIDANVARRSLFGSKDRTAQDRESVDAYLNRFMPAQASRARKP